MNLTIMIKNDNIVTRKGGITMAFREAQQFNEIIEEINNLINWYENTHVKDKSIRMFLSNEEVFTYRVRDEHIAHLLGINTNFLVGTNMFNTTSSYELVKEFIKNSYRFGTRINNNEIKLSDIFSHEIITKLKHFKENINISLDKTLFICSYDASKQYNDGMKHNKCDYIVIQELDDGTILELDLVREKSGKVIPMSNKAYDDIYEAEKVFESLLKEQSISMLSSISIRFNNGYTDKIDIYQNEQQRILKLQKLKKFKKNYKCHIDLVSDCEHYISRNLNNKNEGRNTSDIYDKIISCILDGKIIKISKLGVPSSEINEQTRMLINAINDKLMLGNNNYDNERSYSSLEKKVKKLTEAGRIFEQENKELKNKNEILTTENSKLNEENEKAKVLIKTFKSAINEFENPTE